VNKYLHTVASVGFLFTLNYDARNRELKVKVISVLVSRHGIPSHWGTGDIGG